MKSFVAHFGLLGVALAVKIMGDSIPDEKMAATLIPADLDPEIAVAFENIIDYNISRNK